MKLEHTERMRVNWVDTDGSGLIHYTAALRYFEVPEHALMRELFTGRGFMLPCVHVEADYAAALRYPDEFDCTCRLAGVGRSSVTWEYEIVRTDGVRAITGRIVAAAVGEDGQPMEIPAEFRERLGLPPAATTAS
jgi:YbgC/YbaW family acyl-CoA thioester hydrolase